MSVVLLDTNIVSYVFKRDSRAALYAPHLLGKELAIAIMSVAELFQWAAVRHWGEARVRQLEAEFEKYTILPVDMDVCRFWANVRAQRSALGSPISPQDAWLAATALRHSTIAAFKIVLSVCSSIVVIVITASLIWRSTGVARAIRAADR